MKKLITIVLISISALAYSNQQTLQSCRESLESKSNFLQESLSLKQGFIYIRFSTAEANYAGGIHPGLGIGYRRLTGDGALDILISGIGYAEHKNHQIFWSAPKASYIHYFQPESEKSLYAGGGLIWGGLSDKKNDFVGIIPTATVGYEFLRKNSILSFVELNLSQPAIKVYQRGKFPGPIIDASLGVGF